MARKSAMARAGKMAKRAFNEKCRLEEVRKQMRKEAENGPLHLCEVVPPCIQGIEAQHLADEMATVAELTEEGRLVKYGTRIGLAYDPNGFGKDNLCWFADFWRKALSKISDQAAELTKMEPVDSEQLFAAELRKIRFQTVINYLETLIQLSHDRVSMPVLPQCRSWNYLYKGCPVMVFLPARSDFLPSRHHRFVPGDIVAVANGQVTVQFDREIQVYPETSRCRLTYRADSMRVVRAEDFQRLLGSSYYRGGWLKLSAAYEQNPQLAADVKEAYELLQIAQKVGDYEFVAKIRSERKWKTPC